MPDNTTHWTTRTLAVVLAALTVLSMAGGVVSAAGTTSISVSPAQSELAPGETTTVEVVLDDADGGVGSGQVGVQLSDPSVATIVDVAAGSSPGSTDLSVAADGSAASAVYAFDDTADAGSVTVLTVTLEGQAAGTTAIDVVSPSEAGGLDLGLFLSDEGGTGYTLSSVGSATLTVAETNAPPTVSITGPSSAQVGDELTFEASAADADGSVAGYDWTLGDGTTVSGQSVTHAYAAAGEYEVEVSVTDDDGATTTATQTVTVTEAPAPADFQVSGLTAPTTATQGDSVTVSATVENVGGQQATQTVAFSFDGSVAQTESVTLAGGASQTVSFAVDTAGVAAGTYTHGVATDNDTATAQLTVSEPTPDPVPADFQVTNLAVPSPVTQGDSATVTATVENVGDEQGTQTVSLSADGSAVGSEELTLAGGASQQVSFAVDTTGLSSGAYAVVLATENDSASATMTVEAEADPEPPADGQASTNVSLSPSQDLLGVNQNGTYDIVVDPVDGGVGAYSITLSLSNPSVGSIAGVELAGGGLSDVQLAEDGSSVTIETVMVDTNDTGPVTLGTVAVQGAVEGESDLSIDVTTLGTEAGTAYDVDDVQGSSLTVTTLVVGDSDGPAADGDDDGLHEDVNGDGVVDVLDVQTLFYYRNSDTTVSNPEAFDFNGDGTFDILDVQWLYYNEVAQNSEDA
ncbi:CARDB protein [Halogeometricum rufum]|uniref:CARDB protein n=1 Tax=Halogeometricum rufum TaxID=553469 RepID=A0A1I6IS11_9EURY|nr:PKD domain-containing protein [Halogeometricum rufum]SFR69508.1 CARDB protein [Halogeometricum rufum]